MKRCIYCGKKWQETDGSVCSHCQENNDLANATVRDVHEIHQNAHNNINRYSEKKNSALVFLVTGIILLIVGFLFLFLSFKYNQIKVREFRPNSVEFVVSMICLVVSLGELTYGIIKLTRSQIMIGFYKKVIEESKLKK